MNRSQINAYMREASAFWQAHGWVLPPNPRWDVTDFGVGQIERYGLVLVNLAEEAEYCEKIMYARAGMETPAHYHKKKKEDIICRAGKLALRLSYTVEGQLYKLNGEVEALTEDTLLNLSAGERITLLPYTIHAFWPQDGPAMIGEVSTANDDASDNYFISDQIGRFSDIIEDEAPLAKLVQEL